MKDTMLEGFKRSAFTAGEEDTQRALDALTEAFDRWLNKNELGHIEEESPIWETFWVAFQKGFGICIH